MPLIGIQNVTMAYGGPPLLDEATLHIERGERIALVGRNGEGKSTLMRLLCGEEKPDAGMVVCPAGTRISFLPQEVPASRPGTVLDLVRAGMTSAMEDWHREQAARQIIGRMELEPDTPFDTLSGGQKRRALLARALAAEPEILLLDEPTNHLDLASIAWLENFLSRYAGAVMFVTHDRAFLQRLANRIVELDRGHLQSWDCTYDRYLVRRQEALLAEEKQNALFDKKLAQEEVWVRQGIKARRTRNEGRVRALQKLREERRQRRDQVGRVSLALQQAERSGRKVITADAVSFSWKSEPVLRDVTTVIMRGDKVGVIGPNGCGKTTLLKILLGELAPDAGRVEQGTNLAVAYFDQHREKLDETRSVAENVCGDNSHVEVNGQRRHIYGYLEDFLFSPDRARTPVRALSGGERNRLLLARLFTRPANVLVLDEPTNDLDMETLELLEDLLVRFTGTLLLVSHDRAFLNNVITSTLVFEGEGKVAEYVGGYDDWMAQRTVSAAGSGPEGKSRTPPRPRKPSNREREELKAMPVRIERLEEELASVQQALNDPETYRNPDGEVKKLTARVEALPAEIEAAYARWHALEELSGAGTSSIVSPKTADGG